MSPRLNSTICQACKSEKSILPELCPISLDIHKPWAWILGPSRTLPPRLSSDLSQCLRSLGGGAGGHHPSMYPHPRSPTLHPKVTVIILPVTTEDRKKDVHQQLPIKSRWFLGNYFHRDTKAGPCASGSCCRCAGSPAQYTTHDFPVPRPGSKGCRVLLLT